ncbi:LppA family lipoprotein [Cellulomonas sp. C5510]|nr:LppA family lipoprotein [Cellulomonas sp. C5510]
MIARPTMEQMLDHYEPMLREMVATLDNEIGGLDWYAAPDILPMGWANCSTQGAITEAQEFHPVGLTADGTYDRSDWGAVVAIIREVGGRYGFESQGYLVDRPTDMTFIGRDRYGASYSFDMGRHSVLVLRTGCHLWENKPGLDYTRRSPLDGPAPTPAPGTSTSPPA